MSTPATPSRSFFQYWQQSQVVYQLELGEPLDHSGSGQLRRVSKGDVVWLVTVDPEGDLYTVGRIHVGAVLSHREAIERFGEQIWDASTHIAAQEGTEAEPRLVSLMDIASDLRFQSSSGKDRLNIKDGDVNPQQLQTMRLLTVESARLVEQGWEMEESPGESEIEAQIRGGTEKSPDTSELEAQISRGAGFGSPEQNKKVEDAAIKFVTEHFTARGWDVESVERANCGYDLKCLKKSQREDVEVKGVSGTLPAFIITRGEVNQAKNNPLFVLCVVTNALSSDRRLWRYSGEEFLASYDMDEIAFRAKPRRQTPCSSI